MASKTTTALIQARSWSWRPWKAHGTIRITRDGRAGLFVSVVWTPNRKVPHGQALRDLRQGAAIRTPRQSRQEPGEPEVHAQPADGSRDGGRKEHARPRLHALPADLRGVGFFGPLPDPQSLCTSSSFAKSFFSAVHTRSCTSTSGVTSE